MISFKHRPHDEKEKDSLENNCGRHKSHGAILISILGNYILVALEGLGRSNEEDLDRYLKLSVMGWLFRENVMYQKNLKLKLCQFSCKENLVKDRHNSDIFKSCALFHREEKILTNVKNLIRRVYIKDYFGSL